MTMKEIKLKPCPFCGGKADICEHNDFLFVKCQVCDCRIPTINANIKYCALERAADLWNRRADK